MGQGAVPLRARALRGARAHQNPVGSAPGSRGRTAGDRAQRVLADGAVPVAGGGELYTWGWGKWHLCFGTIQPPQEQLLVSVLSLLSLLSLYEFHLYWGLLCSLPPHKHQEQLPCEAPGPHFVMAVCLQVNTDSWDTGATSALTRHAVSSTWWPRGCGRRRWFVGPGPPIYVCWSYEGPITCNPWLLPDRG